MDVELSVVVEVVAVAFIVISAVVWVVVVAAVVLELVEEVVFFAIVVIGFWVEVVVDAVDEIVLFDVFIPVVAVVFLIDLVGDKVVSSTLSFWVSRTVREKKLCQDKTKKKHNFDIQEDLDFAIPIRLYVYKADLLTWNQ